MILVSVIIPVYNAGIYLEECLNSVSGQTLYDIEIICINDGSTDNSLAILQEGQLQDQRIKIINQINSGVSVARNAGIEIAEGKYIGFVDADDTVEPAFFQHLYQAAEKYNADAVYSKLDLSQKFDEFNSIIVGEDIKRSLLPKFFMGDDYNSSCNKIFRNSVIKEKEIRFPKGIRNGEDAQFNIEFLVVASRVAFLDYCGYNYREVEGSATRNVMKGNYLERAVEVYGQDWTPIICDHVSPSVMLEAKKIRFANNIMAQVFNYAKPRNGLSFTEKWSILKKVTENNVVKDVFSDQTLQKKLKLNRYKNTIFDEIKNKSVLKLYLLTLYSYFKNK